MTIITALDEVPDGYQQQLAARISDTEHLPLNTYGVQPNWVTDDGVATLTLHTAGSGYSANDILTLVQASASGCTIRVDTVETGGVATFTILTPGLGYSVANELATTVAPAGGTGCKLNVTAIVSRTVIDKFVATKDTVTLGVRTVETADVDSAYYKVEIEAADKAPDDISALSWA